jgi:hypothetical protein
VRTAEVSISPFTGDLPDIAENVEKLYEGNLMYYIWVLNEFARNLYGPYHNFRHITHATWLCYDACRYYAKILDPRQMRNILIAELFHDFDHFNRSGNDDLNIEIALRGLKRHIDPIDRPFLTDISNLIIPTEYPYRIPTDALSLCSNPTRCRRQPGF